MLIFVATGSKPVEITLLMNLRLGMGFLETINPPKEHKISFTTVTYSSFLIRRKAHTLAALRFIPLRVLPIFYFLWAAAIVLALEQLILSISDASLMERLSKIILERNNSLIQGVSLAYFFLFSPQNWHQLVEECLSKSCCMSKKQIFIEQCQSDFKYDAQLQ